MSNQIEHNSTYTIDAHAHYGRYFREGADALSNSLMSATASVVDQRAHAAGIQWTIVSPLSGLLPRGKANAVEANRVAMSEVEETDGLLLYAIVNPLQPKTFDQAKEMVKEARCVGIKVHPEEHQYPICDHGDTIFRFTSKLNVPTLVHSGCPNSLPEDFLPFADKYPEGSIILAHLGNGAGMKNRPDLQVRAIAKARHGNLYTDTSSSRSIMPGLLEWAVGEIGADRILFGTDTPLYSTGMQKARVDEAAISDQDKKLILRENARKLFNIN